jgi:hypothetical protein
MNENQTRRYPRTLNEAFPNSPEYANAIERYDSHAGSGLFEFILLLIALAALAMAIVVFL